MGIVIIRTALLYITIIAAVRFMGKRQISDLQTSELVVTMLLSDIASMAAQNTSQPLMSGIVPMIVLVTAEVILSGAMLKFSFLRKLICGNSLVVINNGEVDKNQLRRLRMSVDELSEELRQQNILSFDDVLFAVVETNGKLSVIKKPEKENPTLSDIGITADESGVEAVVISDGALNDSALKICGVDRTYITNILKKKNLNEKDIFVMTMNRLRKYKISATNGKKYESN